MAVELVVKKWGNSVGVVFPKEFATKKHLKANQKILVEVVKEADIRNLHGSLPRKMSGQAFKDMVRKGWQ